MVLRSLWKLVSKNRLLGSNVRTFKILAAASLNRVDTQRRFRNATSQDHCDTLNVTWVDGTTSQYPSVYLRDICQCPLCFHKVSQERLLDTISELDRNIRFSSITIEDNGKILRVHWPDKHVSEFESEWLLERRLPTSDINETSSQDMAQYTKSVELWGHELTEKIPRFEYNDVMGNDSTLLSWLTSLSKVGLTQITKVPSKQGYLKKLGDRIGWLKQTTYGFTYDVRTKWSKYNVAYTSQYIPPHTDLPHQQYKPGIQFLQCIRQTQTAGGDNCFTDGFNIVQLLKMHDRPAYDFLSTTPVLWEACGQDAGVERFHHQLARPIIEFDTRGRLVRINHNEGTRQLFVNTPVERQMEAYRAYYVITALIRHHDNVVWHKMAPGEMVVMDNERILHGRSAFSMQSGSDRWLHGAYMDWDVANSKIRILARKLGIPCPI